MTHALAAGPSCARTADISGWNTSDNQQNSDHMTVASTLDLRVHSIGYLAETIRSFELRSPDGTALPAFAPGAHIDIAMPGDISRSYSLTNSSKLSDRYLIAINRDINSRGGSAFMCETLRVGEMVKVSAPRNSFPLAEQSPRSLFIAGGIGITPILSMIARLEELGRSWQLHYAVRDRAHAAFLDRLAGYDPAGSDRVHVHIDAEAGWLLDVAAVVSAQRPDTELYCCGPTPMIDAFKAANKSRDPDRMHVEHFAGSAEKPTGEFKVILARRKQEFTIPAGRTIIEVLMEAGIRVAYSCREGVCGTCETRVLEGIPDHKDKVLSPREQASNTVIMICCSGAKSDRLVLDL
jgi:vanillate O-demethylase ferredoxin subunit